MKRRVTYAISCWNFSSKFYLLLILSFCVSYASFGVDISGPSRTCPGQTYSYTASDFPALYTEWRWAAYRTYAGNTIPLGEPHFAGGTGVPSSSKTFSVATPSNYQGNIVIEIKVDLSFANITTVQKLIAQKAPSPAEPNGGQVIGCAPNESVAISSTPFLQNNGADCYFHCSYDWSAPSGWVLGATGYPNANPLRGADKLIFPSGLSNGNQGQLTVTAIYSECNSFLSNTSSNASIWYGPPILSNPTISPSSSGSTLRIDNSSNATLDWSIVSIAPGGWINPEGNTGTCHLNGGDGVIKVRATNRCGYVEYFFYVGYEETFAVYPNPARDVIIVESKESKSTLQNVKIYNFNNEVVKSYVNDTQMASKGDNKVDINVKDLARGKYFIHIKTESGVNKSQIVIE